MAMLSAGYLLKRVVPPPEWLVTAPNHIKDVCSVSDCVNDNVVDVQDAWKHNSFGVANSPSVLWALTEEACVDTSGAQLFYYAAYERELESDGWTFDATSWRPRSPARSAGVEDAVEPPTDEETLSLVGYDVVVFGDYLEHSPLSCNSAAREVQVNEHCLFPNLESAVEAINAGRFGGGCEDGAYTVFAVYLVT
ncbi:hypothetical protein [Sphingomonas sp. UNC305MFCol5.2]|uniref:hypothetical protein n=1 Tax=Sphingomonas sp. UNC305MFCol5.2 TaxID=1449076 RepID=UPI00068D3D31|nr:hypothetical protein [Sphingomonas sp. UNC305MFCol5.2]